MDIEELPITDNTDQVQFHLLKSVPFHKRVAIILVLVIVGAALQVFIPLPFAYLGLGCFIAVGLLMMTVGCSNNPHSQLLKEGGQWKKAPVSKLYELKELHKKVKSWDADLLDISNASGFVLFIVVCAVIGLPIFLFTATTLPNYLPLMLGSAGAILLPIWFSGMRRGYTNDNMMKKIGVLESVLTDFNSSKQGDESVEIMLQLDETGDVAIPRDIKLQLSWPSASKDFYGVQCQVNMNEVQGKLYPYCYFVAVMKRNMNFPDSITYLAEHHSITVESEMQSDVKVLIIRGYTTKTSGYHTTPVIRFNLLSKALIAGRSIAEKYNQ